MPLQRRIPKRGFTNIFRKEYSIVNLSDLEQMSFDGRVTPEIMLEKGIIRDLKLGVKILGMGELTKGLTVQAHKFSKTAVEKIQAVGGKAEVI